MLWILFAFGSAFFAGVTAVLAKIGIEHISSTLATAVRTIVGFLLADGVYSGITEYHWADLRQYTVVFDFVRDVHGGIMAVLL